MKIIIFLMSACMCTLLGAGSLVGPVEKMQWQNVTPFVKKSLELVEPALVHTIIRAIQNGASKPLIITLLVCKKGSTFLKQKHEEAFEALKNVADHVQFKEKELIFVEVSHPEELALLISQLRELRKFDEKDQMVTLAYGDAVALVNEASQKLPAGHAIDVMIHIQAPQQRPHKSFFKNDGKKNLPQPSHFPEPRNFKKVYNLFIQDRTDRTLRQQPRIVNNTIVSPVPNIRLLKVDRYGNITDLEQGDVYTSSFIKSIPYIIRRTDRWGTNFHFLVVAFDEHEAEQKRHFELLKSALPDSTSFIDHQRPRSFSVIAAIEHYVQLRSDGNLWIAYGPRKIRGIGSWLSQQIILFVVYAAILRITLF